MSDNCIESVASPKVNVNKVNIVYGIVLILVQVVPFDVHFNFINNAFICMGVTV